MAHAQSGANRARRKKILKMAKGYYGRSKSCITVAREKVEKGLRYAYRDRRTKKRNFRSLWIQRINAGVREHDMVYSQFISGLIKAGVEIDRKVLSDLATHEPAAFKAIVDQSKAALAKKAA
ncbi:MAG: 50S ribosomal protein L20 [Pseudomonadota bacterium]